MTRGRRAAVLLVAVAVGGCGGGGRSAGTASSSPAPSAIVGYRVPSEAMIPTLQVGDHIRVDTAAYEHARPRVGDVVVFHPPVGADTNECGATIRVGRLCPRPTSEANPSVAFVKRIVAGPGDRVKLVSGIVFLNGRRVDEIDHIKGCSAEDECSYPTPLTVPAGHWFVLGDNRGASDDSRFWGPIKTDWIVGKVLGV